MSEFQSLRNSGMAWFASDSLKRLQPVCPLRVFRKLQSSICALSSRLLWNRTYFTRLLEVFCSLPGGPLQKTPHKKRRTEKASDVWKLLFHAPISSIFQSQFLLVLMRAHTHTHTPTIWIGFLFVCLFVWNRVSLCSSGSPGTHSIDQAGLKLTEILLPMPPECWY